MGEINTSDEFGQNIVTIVRAYNINNILEIGSWDGTGSTSCFVEAMRGFPTKQLICVEPLVDRYNQLVENMKQYDWVSCHNTASISYKSLLDNNFENIWSSPYNKLTQWVQKDLANKWFDDDIQMLKTFDSGYLEDHSNGYDGALIDGSEFTGFSEFEILKDKVNFFFLDDCDKAFKTNRILNILTDDPEWSQIIHQPNVRNGYAIFRRNERKLEYVL
jgi:hypothetical protein